MDTKVRQFQDLRVWQEAHRLALAIYKTTQRFPKEELYGLTSQLRRAAVSISANIAEGSKRPTTKDLSHFLSMSEGSNEEVKCLLQLARDLGYLDRATFDTQFSSCQYIGAMLNSLRHSLHNLQF